MTSQFQLRCRMHELTPIFCLYIPRPQRALLGSLFAQRVPIPTESISWQEASMRTYALVHPQTMMEHGRYRIFAFVDLVHG